MLSSAWESEQRQYDMIDWSNPKNNWMLAEVKQEITAFQDSQIEAEFAQAVAEHRVEEVYWVGGEPLMYEQHWRYMRQIVEQGDGGLVYARYNTNLSRVQYRGIDLYSDILDHIRNWQICASIDGTGAVGEYIRTGLSWPVFLENFRRGVDHMRHPRQMRLDFTLTLPGMFEIVSIMAAAKEMGVDVLAKIIFSFTPDVIMSPLALPRSLLHPWIDELLPEVTGAMQDMLIQLKQRPTFDEQWPDTYRAGLVRGKARVLKLESIRSAATNMQQILQQRPEVARWWNEIPG
jgi:hypothetical protein